MGRYSCCVSGYLPSGGNSDRVLHLIRIVRESFPRSEKTRRYSPRKHQPLPWSGTQTGLGRLVAVCRTCDILWREYAQATAEHIKLLSESQIVVIERDTAGDNVLEAAIADAGHRRQVARMEIREHEAKAHTEKPN
jgi:hypothetical protein